MGLICVSPSVVGAGQPHHGTPVDAIHAKVAYRCFHTVSTLARIG